MSTYKDHLARSMSTKRPAMAPKPSSSVILISPSNQVLLLHRVQSSSAFPSAHVFPGGNVSPAHDGAVPAEGEEGRHTDSPTYRLAAIRETFEESGILLARTKNGTGRLLELPDDVREAGRRDVHAGRVLFPAWLAQHGGMPDTKHLIPFTRWVTPPQVPRRFTTQMYLYALPVASQRDARLSSRETVIPTPTPDGGIEHTAARFLPAAEWLRLAADGSVILYPPQYTLLHLVARFLTPPPDQGGELGAAALDAQRRELFAFASGGEPRWAEVVTSPASEGRAPDGREILSLSHLPPELEGSPRRGIEGLVLLVKMTKGGFRELEVRSREDVAKWKNEGPKM